MYEGTQGSERRSSAKLIGAVAQLGERLLCKQEVVGSIPSGSTNSGWRRDRTGSSSMHLICIALISSIAAMHVV